MADNLPQGEVLVIIDVLEIHDPDRMTEYQQAARAQMIRRGGRATARGGVTFEGETRSISQLVQHWASAQDFYDWQASEEYRPWKEARQEAMTIRMTVLPTI